MKIKWRKRSQKRVSSGQDRIDYNYGTKREWVEWELKIQERGEVLQQVLEWEIN